MASSDRDSWVVNWADAESLLNAIQMTECDDEFGLWLYNAMFPVFVEAEFNHYNHYPVFSSLEETHLCSRQMAKIIC